MESTGLKDIHWSYFLTLEDDLNTLSRYIEFHPDNYNVYSAEITKIFLSASSEVDVISKEICKRFDSTKTYKCFGDRYNCLKNNMALFKEIVFICKAGLQFIPFSTWSNNTCPNWWTMYNKVKHERNEYYSKANLENCLLSMSALFLLSTEFYSHEIDIHDGEVFETFFPGEYLTKILANTQLFRLSYTYYPEE